MQLIALGKDTMKLRVYTDDVLFNQNLLNCSRVSIQLTYEMNIFPSKKTINMYAYIDIHSINTIYLHKFESIGTHIA